MAHIRARGPLATNKFCLTKGAVGRFFESSCSGLKADLHLDLRGIDSITIGKTS
jgi:hypothetical protein